MAFNINAHVILSGPKNIKAVTKSIQNQLGTVNARINLVAPKNLSKQIGAFNQGLSRLNKSVTTLQTSANSANAHLKTLGTQFRSLNKSSLTMSKSQSNVQKSLDKTGKSVGDARNEIQAFGKDAALAIRRFAAFTVATGVVFGFVRAIQSATKAAIDYERELVKVVQVTGASADKIKGLSSTINQLSVSLGVDANELAELARMFAQTGQTIDQVRSSINAVAKSSLAPTFGSMKDTAEGLIAAMAQFNIAASQQEAVLASLNAVSKKFAVESEDLISVIRRAGGVFAASRQGFEEPIEGLQQLIGIFTAVRSTTRESADTIAVGLRTIFTRIQRRGTIEFLKQFNIELVDTKGNFVGLFPAFQALSKGLDQIIKSGDALTLSAITEELGGVRQVGKLIPAITQFNKALQATKIAGEAAKQGLGQDVALALQPLGKQFELLQQRFSALIRDITQTKTFQNMAKIALSMANAFLSVAETLKPLLPMLATLAAVKISKGLFEFGKGFVGGLRKGGGAEGMGGTLGGAVTGGGGGGASGGAARAASTQQALTTAIKSHSSLLTSNNAALKALGGQVTSNTTAINAAGGKVAAISTQMIGSMGSLINALNRSANMRGFSGGKKFARGGYVSGPSHAQGGVPAVLEGGEYVIPKGYARGAEIRRGVAASRKDPKFRGTTQEKGLGKISLLGEQVAGIPDSDAIDTYGGAFLSPEGGTQDLKGRLDKGTIKKSLQQTKAYTLLAGASQGSPLRKELTEIETAATQKGDFTLLAEALSKSVSESIEDTILSNVESAVQGGAKLLGKSTKIDAGMADEAVRILRQSNIDNVIGNIYEAILSNAGTPYHKSDRDAANAPFDFPKGLGKVAKNFSAGRLRNIETDAKTRFTSGNISSFLKKAKNAEAGRLEDEIKKILDRPDILAEFSARGKGSEISPRKKVEAFKAKAIKKAAGGSIFAPKGTDTVPAMLTPGEFVVNKKSAQSFGYGNLKKINKYAKGGVAATGNVQYLAGGSGGGEFGAGLDTKNALSQVERLIKTFNVLDQKIAETTESFMKGDKTYEEMVEEVDKLQRGIMKTNESLGKEHVGKQQQGSAPGIWRAMGSPKAKAADAIHRAREMDTVDPNKATAAQKATEDAAQKSKAATEKAAAKMNALTDVVGNSIGAIGGFTVALSSMDFSSPQAAMSSLMSLSFAITQAQSAMASFAALTKLGAASEAAETAANVVATGTEVGESIASSASAKSEWEEVRANMASSKSEFMKGAKGGLEDIFGKMGKKGGKGGKGMLGGAQKLLSKLGGGKGISKGLGGAAKMLTGSMAKLAPMIGKLSAGLGVGALASMLIGPIGNAISDLVLGKKEEIAPGVTGRRGVSDTKAGFAGAATQGAQGAAMGAAIGSVVPVIGTAIGAVIGGLAGAAKGWFTEQAGQLEFNAIETLQKSGEKLSKTFEHLAKLGDDAGPAALEKVNEDIEAVLSDTIKAFDASKIKGLTDSVWTFGNALETVAGGGPVGLVGAVAGGGIDAKTGQLARVGAEGFMESSANVADSLMSKFTGNMFGAEDRIKGRARTGEGKLTADALKTAADQIGPETFQAMDTAIQSMMGNLINDMGALEQQGSLETLATMDPMGELDTGTTTAAENSAKLDASFGTLSNTLKNAEGGTGAFAEQLDRLVRNSLKMHLIKDVAEELKILETADPKMATELAVGFNELNKTIDWSKDSIGKIKDTINDLDVDPAAKDKLREIAEERQREVVAMAKQAAVLKLAEMASRRARKALDALAAGLDHFGAKTAGIADQTTRLAGQLEAEFAQITGEKTIGDIDRFNPFENVAAASDQQIDSAISQLQSLGSEEEANVAFADMGGLIKAQRDMPLIMRNVLNDLKLGKGAGGEVSNTEVTDAIKQGLKDQGIELPEQALTALTAKLSRGGDRQDKKAFSMDKLTEIFEKDGDVLALLGEVSANATEELGRAFGALGEFKQSLLVVAKLQQEMAKRRLEGELAILSKQESIRDRINNALGTGADAFDQAVGDLQKRMGIQIKGGLKPGQGTPVGGDVLDPQVLFDRLKTLDQKRETARGKMGMLTGQAALMGGGGDATKLAKEMRENSDVLGRLNSEINGTEAALKELANDTRMLAAIEGKIHEQNARAKTAEGGFTGMAAGLGKLMSGDMSRKDFQAQILDPMQMVEDAFDPKKPLSFSDSAKMLQGFQGGDPIIKEQISKNVDKLAEQRGVDKSDTKGMRALRKEVINNLVGNMAGAGQAIADELGIHDFGAEMVASAERMFEAQDEADKLGAIMQEVGDMQVNILQKTMDREEAKMAAVLDKADAGFQKAAAEFAAAVREFALFRGGVTSDEVQVVGKEVQAAENELRVAQADLDHLATITTDEQGKKTITKTDAAKAEITKAGDDAAAAARAEWTGKFDPTEVERRVGEARSTAESDATAEQDRRIRDKQAKVTIKRNAVTAKKDLHKRLQLTHEADKKDKKTREEETRQTEDTAKTGTDAAESEKATEEEKVATEKVEDSKKRTAEKSEQSSERATSPIDTEVAATTGCCSDIIGRLDMINNSVQELSQSTTGQIIGQVREQDAGITSLGATEANASQRTIMVKQQETEPEQRTFTQILRENVAATVAPLAKLGSDLAKASPAALGGSSASEIFGGGLGSQIWQRVKDVGKSAWDSTQSERGMIGTAVSKQWEGLKENDPAIKQGAEDIGSVIRSVSGLVEQGLNTVQGVANDVNLAAGAMLEGDLIQQKLIPNSKKKNLSDDGALSPNLGNISTAAIQMLNGVDEQAGPIGCCEEINNNLGIIATLLERMLGEGVAEQLKKAIGAGGTGISNTEDLNSLRQEINRSEAQMGASSSPSPTIAAVAANLAGELGLSDFGEMLTGAIDRNAAKEGAQEMKQHTMNAAKGKQTIQDSLAANKTVLKGSNLLDKLKQAEQQKEEVKGASIGTSAGRRPEDVEGRALDFMNAARSSPDRDIMNYGMSLGMTDLPPAVQQKQVQDMTAMNVGEQRKQSLDSPDQASIMVAAKKPSTPEVAAGNVFDELRQTMQGKEIAEKMGMVFEVGGDYVAEKISQAFKGAIPPKIEMTGQLGAITVHLVGGKVLQKFNDTIIETMRKEIKEGIERAVKPEARNELSASAGTTSSSTPAASQATGIDTFQ